MSSLANLKGQRARLTKKIKLTMESARNILASDISEGNMEDILEEIDVTLETGKDLCNRFETLSTKIVEAMSNKEDEELEAEGESSIDVLLELCDTVSRLTARQRKLSRQQQQSSQGGSPAIAELTGQVQTLMRRESMQDSTSLRPGGSVNLPKLDFDCFAGDILRWYEFWDSFAASIHHNPNLHDVQKLAYLRAKLRGEAKSVIAGLETTSDNYEVALGLLKQRFGNQQAAISPHYSKLMDLQPVPNQTNKLRLLTDSLEQELRCLSSLGEDVNHRHFISLIMHKLPEDVITKLEEMKGAEEEWSVEQLRNKLQNHLTAREAASRHSHLPAQGTNYNQSSDNRSRQFDPRRQPIKSEWNRDNNRHQNRRFTTETLYSNDNATRQHNFSNNRREYNNVNRATQAGHEKTSSTCVFCGGKHWSDECRRYRTVVQRKQQVRDRCFNCLRNNHKSDNCLSMKPCFPCKSVKQHHTSLCPIKFSSQKETSHVANETTEVVTTDESLLASGERAILQTAIVDAFSPSSQRHATLRLLFDSGSHRSYISEDAARMLQLQAKATETISVNTFAEKKSKNVQTQIVDIHLKTKDNSFTAITTNVVPTISASIQRLPIDLSRYNNLLKDIQIADPAPMKPEQGSIDILIGSDYYMDLLTFEKKPLGNNLYLLGSKFGWILAGRSAKTQKSTKDYSMLILHHNNQSVSQLNGYKQPDKSIPLDVSTEDFWTLETLGIKDAKNDVDDDKAISNFNSSVKQYKSRYFVKWPWKEEFPTLPTNFQLSYGRLRSLLRRLSTNTEMFQKYNAIIEDQLAKGVIEKVTSTSSNESTIHYIPHQAVVKPGNSTTKVRIVYDASAKVSKNVLSLNECLLRGPVILENLCGLLMRFRLHKYAVVADIEKAFLQIGLQEKDRDSVRFLWIKDPGKKTIEDNLQIYRFARVPFGVISSPFLLAATIQLHLNNVGTNISKQLSKDIYVDNIITGASSEKELQQLYTEGKDLFRQASMNLREWTSNNKDFHKSIADADISKDKMSKVLGLYWDIDTDNLSLAKVKCEIESSTITKREVFKKVAQFFDPIGQFTPVPIRAKMYIQELWSEKISWDERLSPEMKAKWIDLLVDLNKLNQLNIPRYIGITSKDAIESRLVCFCDASSNAYATVIYLHQTSSNNMTKATIIFSKSRLAPIKRQTIPRLELLAVLIGVRAIKFTEEQLQIQIKDKSIWSDSQCVLHWIKSRKLQPTFIQNRLSEIKSHTDVTFNYVKSENNPADIPSRGLSAKDIKSCNLWWRGPEWLNENSSKWPKEEIKEKNECKDIPDVPKVLFEASLAATEHKFSTAAPFELQISHFSKLLRLLRVTAWANRFIQRESKSLQTS